MTWYKSGTVSVAQNSNAVMGVGTAFIANSRVGDAWIGPDSGLYEVTNIASDTALSISPPYKGSTVAGGTYALAPMQGYLKATADALRQASLEVGDALDGLEESVQSAAESAAAALSSKNTAAQSAAAAGQSETASLDYKNAAGLSANAAAQSEAASLNYKNAAGTSATNAGQSEQAALGYKDAAANSALSAAASAGAAAALGVGRGYIDGLTLGWVSATSISVGAGSAFIPSVGKVVSYAGGTFTPSGAANSFIHVYLTAAGDIEQAATVPLRYYNQAHQKTGDNSRRYIGSLLVGAANNIYKFHHHPLDSSMSYTFGAPQSAPFRILNGLTGIGSVSTAASCPTTAHTLAGSFQTNSGGIAQFTPSDAGTAASVGWQVFVSAGTVQNGTCRIADDRTITYWTSSSNLAYIYTLGYYFDR